MNQQFIYFFEKKLHTLIFIWEKWISQLNNKIKKICTICRYIYNYCMYLQIVLIFLVWTVIYCNMSEICQIFAYIDAASAIQYLIYLYMYRFDTYDKQKDDVCHTVQNSILQEDQAVNDPVCNPFGNRFSTTAGHMSWKVLSPLQIWWNQEKEKRYLHEKHLTGATLAPVRCFSWRSSGPNNRLKTTPTQTSCTHTHTHTSSSQKKKRWGCCIKRCQPPPQQQQQKGKIKIKLN